MSSAMVIQAFLLKNTDDDNMWAGEFQIKKILVLLVEFTVHYLQCNKLLVSKFIIDVTINISTNYSCSCLTFNIYNSATITNGIHGNIALLAQNYFITTTL
jgi:hypothetical protein